MLEVTPNCFINSIYTDVPNALSVINQARYAEYF